MKKQYVGPVAEWVEFDYSVCASASKTCYNQSYWNMQ